MLEEVLDVLLGCEVKEGLVEQRSVELAVPEGECRVIHLVQHLARQHEQDQHHQEIAAVREASSATRRTLSRVEAFVLRFYRLMVCLVHGSQPRVLTEEFVLNINVLVLIQAKLEV